MVKRLRNLWVQAAPEIAAIRNPQTMDITSRGRSGPPRRTPPGETDWADFDHERSCVGFLVVKVCYARFFSSLLIHSTTRSYGGLDFSHCATYPVALGSRSTRNHWFARDCGRSGNAIFASWTIPTRGQYPQYQQWGTDYLMGWFMDSPW